MIKKEFIRRNYTTICIVFSIIFVAIGLYLHYINNSLDKHINLLGTAIGSIFASLFSIQKQITDETKFFNELFKDFNKRYDEISDNIHEISRNSLENTIEDKDKEAIIKYFNLSSEEYLFYKRGFIPEEVWESWSNGIAAIFVSPKIKELWKTEKETKSYYGFNPDNICKKTGIII